MKDDLISVFALLGGIIALAICALIVVAALGLEDLLTLIP